MSLEERLTRILLDTKWFMECLVTVREVNLPCWCIGAGVIRNLVWDHLHDFRHRSDLSDVDIAYFDPVDISVERDHRIEEMLRTRLPDIPWEVTNQAGVHTWFQNVFGHPVERLSSLEEAVSTWPETATAVGITLKNDDSIHVIAPFGLTDLFDMVVRRNPTRVSVGTYRERIAEKQYCVRWPMVKIIPD
jgi:uncharacterized protein